MKHFDELIKEWQRKADDRNTGAEASNAIEDCISDLKETLLLIEAERIAYPKVGVK